MDYEIAFAGSYEGTLSDRGLLGRTYGSRRECMHAIAPALRLDVTAAVWIRVEDDESLEWYLYRSQEDADADDSGAGARVIIRRA